MAYIATNSANARPFGFYVDFSKFTKAVADWRLYRRTIEELEAMSDRDLADLGLSRLSIRDVARDAVYGA